MKRDHREEETRKNSNKSSRRKNFGHELARHRRNRVFFGVHGPSDILYDAMWYIKEDFKNRQHTTNILQYNKDKHLRHMNVEAAWDRGYSGAGVVVTILDDGIETDHPDLKRNYDKDASWDMNDGDDDPMLRYTPGNTNRYNPHTVRNSITKIDMEQDALEKSLPPQIMEFVFQGSPSMQRSEVRFCLFIFYSRI